MSEHAQPTPDEPTTDEPTLDEPTTDEPTTDEPTPDVTPPQDDPTEAGGVDAEGLPSPAAPDEPEASAMSEKEIEKRMASLEKEGTRHANRVSEIMGEDAQALDPCPLCWPFAPGFILPPYFDANADAIKATVRAAWGEAPEPELLPASNARRCDQCGGHGKRLSGSLVPDQRVLLCDTCGGRGWQRVGGSEPHPDLAGSNGAHELEPVVAGESMPDADPWGREPGDANYGRLPQYVTAEFASP